MKRFGRMIAYYYDLIRKHFLFKRKKAEALALSRTKNKRVYVIPHGKTFLLVTNDTIKEYNAMMPKNRRVNFYKLARLAVYITPEKRGE